MLQQTPYTAKAEEYTLIINPYTIDMFQGEVQQSILFVPDVIPLTRITGSFTDANHKTASIHFNIAISGTKSHEPALICNFYVEVKSPETIEIPRVCAVTMQYLAELIEDNIKERPIKDDEGKLYSMPYFSFAADEFKNISFGE